MDKQENTQKRIAPGYLEMIVISLLISLSVVFGYDRFFAQKIKVVDLQGYLRTQKALLTRGEISEQQFMDHLDRLQNTLNQEPGQHIVILKEVVLRNGEAVDLDK